MLHRNLILRGLALVAGVAGLAALAILAGHDLPAPKSDNNADPAVAAAARAAAEAVTAAAVVRSFRDGLWPDALAKGVSRATFERALDAFVPDPEVMSLAASQPEHLRTAGEYVALLVSETRVENGRARLATDAVTLSAVETQFGVDRHIVAAIWGIESGYGVAPGNFRVIRSLATLALADTRRPAFWRGELIAALMILERGDIAPDAMTGSWAGAMGHTQFMPSTYQQFAVDFDRDGRRDIWGTTADALGSAANYLKASGWQAGQPWGFEVRLPPSGFDHGLSAPQTTKTLAEWRGLGVTPVVEPALADPAPPLQLILPAGASGPAVLVTRNFRAILRYNNSVSYALAVGLLADRLAGRGGLTAGWPAGDRALSSAEREELQRRLADKGFALGAPDGILGSETRRAIRAYQKSAGLAEDGHPGPSLLVRLRVDAATEPSSAVPGAAPRQ